MLWIVNSKLLISKVGIQTGGTELALMGSEMVVAASVVPTIRSNAEQKLAAITSTVRAIVQVNAKIGFSQFLEIQTCLNEAQRQLTHLRDRRRSR